MHKTIAYNTEQVKHKFFLFYNCTLRASLYENREMPFNVIIIISILDDLNKFNLIFAATVSILLAFLSLTSSVELQRKSLYKIPDVIVCYKYVHFNFNWPCLQGLSYHLTCSEWLTGYDPWMEGHAEFNIH